VYIYAAYVCRCAAQSEEYGKEMDKHGAVSDNKGEYRYTRRHPAMAGDVECV